MTSEASKDAIIAQLRKRVGDLEQENARLVEQLAAARQASTAPVLGRPPSATRRGSDFAPNQQQGQLERRYSFSDGGSGGSTGLPGTGSSGHAGIAAGVSSSPALLNGVSASTSATTITSAPTPGAAECDNCGREIPSSSLGMHRLHCLRNIKKCAHCGLALAVKDFDDHERQAKGNPALFLQAISSGNCQALGDMLKHGASVTAVCDKKHGDSPLHAAARARQGVVMELLLSSPFNAPINALNENGDTALHILCGAANATTRPRSASASALAPVSSPDKTATGSAAVTAGEASSAVVVSSDGGLSFVPGDGQSSASSSASSTDSKEDKAAAAGAGGSSAAGDPPSDLVSLLLRKGADIEAHTPLGDTPLQVAQRAGNLELAMLLSASGSSLRPSSRDARRRPASARSLQSLGSISTSTGTGGGASASASGGQAFFPNTSPESSLVL